MQGSLRLGRIRGIEIALHPSLLLAFFLIAWTLAGTWLPQLLPRRPAGFYWTLGLIGALGLFVSVLLHEFGHALTAQARGIRVPSITLFIFGGVANIAMEPRTPRDEFWITLFGPLTSLALAGVGAAVWYVTRGTLRSVAALGVVLGFINLQLAVFNLIPGFPLDGGRILRSIIWGVYRILVQQDFTSGLWTAFIGWFLQNAAEATYRQMVAEQVFRGVRVGQLMTPSPVAVEPGTTIARLVEEYILGGRLRCAPVGLGDRLLGIITIGDVQKVPREAWPATYVSEAMTRAADLQLVRDTDELTTALALLGAGEFDQLPVVDAGGRLVGLLTRADVIRYLQLRPLTGQRAGAGPPG